MFNLNNYIEEIEKEFDEKWNLWHETTEQRNAIKCFLRSAIEIAVKEATKGLRAEIKATNKILKIL